MGSWLNTHTDEWHDFDAPDLSVHPSDNDIVGILYGPKDDEVLAVLMEREPLGFRLR